MNGVERIAAERKRQIETEGFTAEHDDKLQKDDLTRAAICYAFGDIKLDNLQIWPFTWSKNWWKPTPKNRIRELEKAGALIAAEIDKLLRLEGNKQGEKL